MNQKIEKLTPEQEALIPVVRDEWINFALCGDTSINEKAVREGIDWLYSLDNYPPPKEVVICDSPLECIQKARKYNKSVSTTSCIGIGENSLVPFYDYFTRIGVINHDGLNRIIAFEKAGVWDCVLLEEIAFVSRRPNVVHRDEQHRLHCLSGPAVSFDEGFCVYAYHGTSLPEKYIMNPDKLSKKEIEAERNSEALRALAEILGWEKFLNKLAVKVLDTWEDKETGLTYELLDLKSRKNLDQAPKFLKMKSPILNDGTQPSYIEPVDPGLKSARAARKWQFPKISEMRFRHGDVVFDLIGENSDVETQWPSVEECNKDAELLFQKET